jgi:hypothetical protein
VRLPAYGGVLRARVEADHQGTDNEEQVVSDTAFAAKFGSEV